MLICPFQELLSHQMQHFVISAVKYKINSCKLVFYNLNLLDHPLAYLNRMRGVEGFVHIKKEGDLLGKSEVAFIVR